MAGSEGGDEEQGKAEHEREEEEERGKRESSGVGRVPRLLLPLFSLFFFASIKPQNTSLLYH